MMLGNGCDEQAFQASIRKLSAVLTGDRQSSTFSDLPDLYGTSLRARRQGKRQVKMFVKDGHLFQKGPLTAEHEMLLPVTKFGLARHHPGEDLGKERAERTSC